MMIYFDINVAYCIFWYNFQWKSNLLFNLMDIVSQIERQGITNKNPILHDKDPLIDV